MAEPEGADGGHSHNATEGSGNLTLSNREYCRHVYVSNNAITTSNNKLCGEGLGNNAYINTLDERSKNLCNAFVDTFMCFVASGGWYSGGHCNDESVFDGFPIPEPVQFEAAETTPTPAEVDRIVEDYCNLLRASYNKSFSWYSNVECHRCETADQNTKKFCNAVFDIMGCSSALMTQRMHPSIRCDLPSLPDSMPTERC